MVRSKFTAKILGVSCVGPKNCLPEEGHVRQQVVALCELIEMLDAATLAPVEKIAQALGARLHGLGVFDVGAHVGGPLLRTLAMY
jgi:hypothetical protein